MIDTVGLWWSAFNH